MCATPTARETRRETAVVVEHRVPRGGSFAGPGLAALAAALAWPVTAAAAPSRPIGDPPPPLLDRPRAMTMWETLEPATATIAASGQVNSHTIYVHRCAGPDCTVVQGATNSTTRPAHSSLGHGVLSPFSQGDESWATVMDCMREVYAPFNVLITDTDPGSLPHFEIMVGGTPQEIGLPVGVGGVSPFSCMPYIPNTVVFVFDVWGNDPEELCATAAQEVAHSFTLDHTIEPSDPMTYFAYKGRRHYVTAQVQCGSDCDGNHRSPLGASCSGMDNQEHACACGSGMQTQNEVQVISSLFGEGETPPTVKIVSPRVGDKVGPGFAVSADITDDVAVASAELRVDGQLIGDAASAPYAFTGPPALVNGTHTIEVTGYDNVGAPGRSRVQVVVGPGCKSAAECPDATDVCIAGRCAAGPQVAGGLGQVCTAATDCSSWMCANSDGAQFCVEACRPGQCPSGFGCRDDGMDGGVCWPGYQESAGCSAGGHDSPIGAAALGLGLIAALRRRRSSQFTGPRS
jgi:MYXO-CTERM domain-containing protein